MKEGLSEGIGKKKRGERERGNRVTGYRLVRRNVLAA